MAKADAAREVRFAELVALLSLGTDLGLGQPMEHAMQQCLIGLRLADRLALDEASRAVVYYSGLLAWVGCHTDAYEQAKWFGDDIVMKREARVHMGPVALVRQLGAGKTLLEGARHAVAFLRQGLRDANDMLTNHYLATDELAARLGLGQDVRDCLIQTFERWDGKGPLKLRKDQIGLTSRIVSFADVVAVFHRTGGLDGAIATVRKRSGSQLDPELAKLFCRDAPELVRDLATSGWDAIISEEPALATAIGDDGLDRALEAIADFADLKSPWRIGHSRQVAELASEAAGEVGLPAAEVTVVRRAALVHDLGHLGVSNGIWDKRGPLGQVELERVRLHPYLGERMLAFTPLLAPLGAIAVQHHERLDGSGYPRGLSGQAITAAGRILGAADVYAAMLQRRPHRAAREPDDAARELRAMVAQGRLDGRAADAVLRAAGHRVRRRREWPAGLTAREIEVLRLLTCGLSNKEIAGELAISPKTAGSHVEHIYAKIGATNRARASLFAMKHGLLGD